MLQFFSIISIIIIVVLSLILFMIVLPMYRFMKKSLAVIRIYNLLKTLLLQDLLKDSDIQISYDDYTLNISSTEEAYTELEKIANDALNSYDKMCWISTDLLKEEKNKLVDICSEIRTLRWKMQGC